MNTYQPFATNTATNILPDMQYSEISKSSQKRKPFKKKAVNQSDSGCKRKKATNKTGSRTKKGK